MSKSNQRRNKIYYLQGIIIGILLVGVLAFGSDAVTTQAEAVKSTQEDLIAKIEAEEATVREMLKEVEARQAQLKLNERDTLRMADWYSKPWYESDFLSVMLSYTYSDSVSKDWVGSRRSNTVEDGSREIFSKNMLANGITGSRTSLENALDYSARMRANGNFSSGWVNDTDAYNANTNLYDYTDKIIILPVVKVPGLTRPDAPVVTVNMPDAPTKVAAPVASVPAINPIAVTIGEPQVTPPAMSPAPTVVAPTLDQIVVNDPGVTVTPANIDVQVTDPTFGITVNPPAFSMSVKSIADIPIINPEVPDVNPSLPTINASPFNNFAFESAVASTLITTNDPTYTGTGSNKNYWGGIKPDITQPNPEDAVTINSGYGIDGTPKAATRSPNLIYIHGTSGYGDHKLYNANLYIKGYPVGGSASSSGETGQIGIHTVNNVELKDIKGYLYGNADFISIETWHGGTVTLSGTNSVEIKPSPDGNNDNNTIFYIFPATYAAINGTYGAMGQRGGVNGILNADINSNKNVVYMAAGAQGSFSFESTGTYTLSGDNNMVYAGLGYTANYETLKSTTVPVGHTTHISASGDMTPTIELITKPIVTGNENVIMLFNTKWSDVLPEVWPGSTPNDRDSFIGIYQGQIQATGNIQSGSKNVGIYAKSGQRDDAGIVPTQHLGAPAGSGSMEYYDDDPIHNLEIGNIDIEFGSGSQDGIMIASELGTVIDIANPASVAGTNELNGGASTSFSDGAGGKRTIIAYSNGTFDDDIHKYGATKGYNLSGANGKPSEINIYIPLSMASKEGVAYFGNNYGIVNANATGNYPAETATTVATGYKSIIGYAQNLGTVKIEGSIKAQEAQYQNIGAYAKDGASASSKPNSSITKTTVTVAGKAEINGIGGLAKGEHAVVELNASDNSINSGETGGLVALDGGHVKFNGGTIAHGLGTGLNYNGKVPFYAGQKDTTTDGAIDFTGATHVEMSKGLLFSGDTADYTNATGAYTSKYNGMTNVDVKLMANGVNLGLFYNDTTMIYANETGYLNKIADFVKMNSGSINPNGKTYDSYLIDGAISVTTTDTIHLYTTTPSTPIAGDDYAFNNITMQNEQVDFGPMVIIKSDDGTGLAMGSNSGATSNASTGYTNSGNIDISGGTNPVAVYTSYGHIKNLGTIKVKDGVAMAGVNGSELENNGTVTVDPASNTGVGMVGIARRVKADGSVETTLESFGKDAGKTGQYVKIKNTGKIEALGAKQIGIYANNNVSTIANRTDVTIDSDTSAATSSIEVGDNSVGIMMENNSGTATAPIKSANAGTITLTGSGSSDITTGKDSVGVYGDNSDIVFNSDYGVNVKEGSAGLYTLGNTNITGNGHALNFDYNGSTSGDAAGIIYIGPGALNNSLDINVNNITSTTGVVAGVYAEDAAMSSTIVNSGKITSVGTNRSYGIASVGADVTNNAGATLTIGVAGGQGGIGIYAKNAAVTASGNDIVMDGDSFGTAPTIYPMGIYAVNDALTVAKAITVNPGPLNVVGKNAIGMYIKDDASNQKLTLNNSSDINMTSSASTTDKEIGIGLENVNTATNSGDIQVNDYNIGIYSKDSNITNTGTLNVTTPPGGSKGGVGMFAEGTTGTAAVAGSTFNVKASTSTTPTDIPMGILVSGSGMTVDGGAGVAYNVDPDGTVAIGNYLDGANNTTTNDFNYNLTSNTSGTIGIGSYYTNGAYGDTGSVTVNSTNTQLDGMGNPIRPIGMYYGASSTQNNSDLTVASGSQEAIGMYGDGLTFTNNGTIGLNAQSIGAYFTNSDVTNNGDVTIASGVNKGYGLYFKGGTSTNNADVNVDGTGSIGIISTGAATVENTGTMVVNGTDTIGGYAEEGATFKNTGTITSGATSIGAFATDTGAGGGAGTVINEGTMDTDNVAMYANNGAIADQNSGDINVNTAAKTGIIVDGNSATANLNGGNIKSTQANVIGVRGDNTGIVNEAGTNITLSGDDSVGISLDNGSQATLTSGDITVGANGTGVSGNLSTIDISNYAGTITMGNKGMGIFAQDTPITATTSTPLNINYTGADKGVGVYYVNPATAAPVTNNVTVNHTGSNLVHIYNDGINMINAADQTVNDGGIAVYSDNSSTLDNQGNITLNGDDSVGIYLANNSTLTNIGNISGGLASTPTSTKVGVYVKSGDVTGSTPYNFNIPGGIGIYLKGNVISYTGDVNVAAASSSDGLQRTIGVYVDPALSGNLVTKINVTGADAIGLYLASDTGAGTAANIVYDGTLDISANSTANRGLGAYLADNTTLTLGTSGIVNIAGQNNIGFYVSSGASLNVTGGTVNNTVDGIFAYLDNGYLHFTSGAPININYANIIVSGPAAQMINDTSINVGNGGLQGDNGATITNNGIINGSTADAKGMVGKAIGTTLNNNGNIILTGDQSVAMYVEDGAIANSTGNVDVSNKSVAYYAGKNGATKGTINVSGTTTIGENSSIMYANGGDINYLAGDITVGNKRTALTLEDAGSVVDFNNSNVIVDANGVGVYVTGTGVYDTGVVNMTDMIVNSNGTGIYLDNPAITFNADQKIDLMGDGALGILAANAGNVDYTGTITGDAGAKEVKGIVAKVTPGTALDVKNSGTIDIKGDSGIGMYANGAALVENTAAGNITIAKGVTGASAVGIYGDTTNVSNKGTVTVADNAVGMYGKDSYVENTGNLVNTVGHSTGIYGENSNVVNNGNIAFGDMSNGAFVQDGVLTNNANVTVGQGTKTAIPGSIPTEYDIKASVGLYGGGTTSIYHNAGATITTGNYGVGIASENGYIETQNGSNFNMGEESVYIYADKGTGVNKTDLTLSDYSVGMYANHGGTLTNEATINVGKSSTVANDLKISVGMATGTNKTNKVTGDVDHIGGGTIVNEGTINVGQPNGVGMIANNNHIDAVDGNFYTGYAENRGVINVTGKDSYGMEASEGATIRNAASGEIYAVGQGARAMAATTGATVINDGYIEVIGTKAEGIYVDRQAKAYNNGTIVVNGTGKKGIYVGQGGLLENEGDIQLINGATEADKKDISGSGTIVNIGKISIDSTGPVVMMDGITINNVGTITVNGALDFNKVSIGGVNSEIGIGSINADTFEGGEMIVLPDLTQGNNQTVRVVQYLNGAINVPNNGSLTAISQSVSWLADLQADPNTTNTYRVVLVKIPYNYLLEGTPAVELGNGMDEIYEGAKGTELEMFDAIDMISDKDELGATMDMEIRGNLYANLQQRVLDINDAFDMAYENLKHDRLYSKDSLKIGAIVTGNKRKFKKADITNYESKTYGVMLLQEYDTRKYGETWNWNIGLAHTDFDFDRDSEEEVYSLNLGAAYERFVGSSYNWKWYTRGEISINHHDTDRKIHLSTGTYTNNAKFWSAKGFWNNKLRYEIPIESKHVKAGVFGTLRLGYGRYDGFKETGDGIRLDLKGHDMYFVRPGIGADIAYTKYTKKGKVVLYGNATYEYELGKQYDGANKAKVRDTHAGYYDLEKPKDIKGGVKLTAGLKYESRCGHSIGVEAARYQGNIDSTRVGVNFMMRVGN